VFHGHSVPAGYYVTPDVRPFEGYPHLVYKGLKAAYPNLQMNCIVTAIGGETSPKGAARFEKDVLTHKPDIIFIDYNVNDRRVKEDAVRKAWSSMIEMAQKEKIPVVLLTPTGVIDAKYDDPQEPLVVRAAIVRELAAKYNCPLADVLKKWKAKIDSGVEPKSLLSNETNHPNLVGHQLAADVVLELFKASDK
jgi:lysophospholipase L1-like esterase